MISSDKIRLATEADSEPILNIYTPYILETPITFETEVPSLLEFQQRFQKISAQFPWLVYEENNQVLGYSYASHHRLRQAYSWSCEVAVYIDGSHHKKGIGRSLYESLFSLLKRQGYCNLYGGVTQPNEGSNRLHEKMGFEKVGTYKNIGFKDRKWHDVTWYQLNLAQPKSPEPPLSINDLRESL